MTRIPVDEEFKGPKGVVQMGPSAGDLLEKQGAQSDADLDGPIKTAASYGSRVKARQAKMAELKKKKVPVGNVPEVESEKMKQLAASLAQPDFGGPPDDLARAPAEPPDTPQPAGVGSGYEVNRAMAEGRVDKPVNMREAMKMESEAKKPQKRQYSPETLELLEKAKEESEKGSMGAEPAGDESVEMDIAEDKIVSDSLQSPMDFLGDESQRALFISKERRDKIEGRLKKLNIADMVIKRELIQDVPVLLDENGDPELVYTLRTYRQHEYLYCLRYVYEHPGSQVYVEELLNTCKMACCLVSINGAHLIEHRDNVGQSSESVNRELFEKKMEQLTSFPVHMAADISVQWAWFNERVNKLFNIADLKNG